jgi:hypothetical protein
MKINLTGKEAQPLGRFTEASKPTQSSRQPKPQGGKMSACIHTMST